MWESIRTCCNQAPGTRFVSRFMTYNSNFSFRHGTKGLVHRHLILNLARVKIHSHLQIFNFYPGSKLSPIQNVLSFWTDRKQTNIWDKAKYKNHQLLRTESYLIKIKNGGGGPEVCTSKEREEASTSLKYVSDNSLYVCTIDIYVSFCTYLYTLLFICLSF